MLRADLMVTANVSNAVCATATDGGITVSGFGGTAPYTNYALTGPVNIPINTTGVFANLPPGTYTVSVTDSALPTPATATLANVFVGPKITVTTNSAICLGSFIDLNAAGSPSGYTWTAVPAATAGLTTPTVANPRVTPTVTTTYTVTSTVGSCAPISASVTVTVNPLPNITSTSLAQTICPGNTATFTITGTPNSTVTLSNPSVIPFTTTVNIGPTGTVNFTTPVLNASVVYQLTKIRGFFTQCERNLIPSNLTLSINVVPNGCATVQTTPAPGTPPLDLTMCTAGECRTLQANISPVPSTTTYTVSSIPYCPQAPFENPTWNNIYPGGPIGDDDWAAPFSLPAGMNFCFYGQNYTQLNVGTNQVIRFPLVEPANGFIPATNADGTFNAGDFCQWSYNTTIPNTGFPIKNSIFGVYQDTDFSVTPPAGTQISVNYQVVGTYPCRKFIANFTNCPQFSCGIAIGLSTSQIVLYEVSNIIEVYVQRRGLLVGRRNEIDFS
jgi:hypothetical protein